MKEEYQTVSSETKYKGEVVSLKVDQVRFPDGTVHLREVVSHPGAVGVVPLTKESQVILIRQHRYPVGKELLEIPAGLPEKGEDPKQTVLRELKEETGCRPTELVKLSEFYLTPGYSDEYFYLFLALEVEEGERELEADEVIALEKMTFNKAMELVRKGTIVDAKTIMGLILTDSYLRTEQQAERGRHS